MMMMLMLMLMLMMMMAPCGYALDPLRLSWRASQLPLAAEIAISAVQPDEAERHTHARDSDGVWLRRWVSRCACALPRDSLGLGV